MPSESGGSKWKLFVFTWLAVLPMLLALSSAIRALLPDAPPLLQTAMLRDARGKLKTAGDSG